MLLSKLTSGVKRWAGAGKAGEESGFEKFARVLICSLLLFAMGLLFVESMIHTTGMDTVPNLEQVSYLSDNVFWNLLMLVLMGLLSLAAMPLMKKLPLKAELIFIIVWTSLLGIIWVYTSQSAPTEDSGVVSNAAFEFAHNDYSRLSDSRYFHNYSYQLGYVLFNEILIRFAETVTMKPLGNLLCLEVLNVLMLAASYAGIILINDKLFEDKRMRHLTVFLLTFSIQPIISCSFLYGIIPGFALAVWALYFEILWLTGTKIRNALLSAVFIALSVLIKSNYIIVLIAMMGIAFVKLFTRKRLLADISYMVLCCALAFAMSPAVKSMYEKRSGVDLGESVPYISWISMGMCEPTFDGCGPGWYNSSCTIGNFEANGFDPKAASKASVETIKKRMQLFADHPRYANDFFYYKFVSQWNETTYQSVWNNNVRGQYQPKTGIAKWVCSDGRGVTEGYMDLYAQLIFAGVLAGTVTLFRKKNLLLTFFPLVILGGFMYHIISESKSQYAMPYFILMTGFAAFGLMTIYDLMQKRFGQVRWMQKILQFSKDTPVAKKQAE